ncbi:MAG: hypothetical protein ACKVX7_08695 [Planctomycetota bacterium]
MPKHSPEKVAEVLKKRREHLKKIEKTGKLLEVRAAKKLVKRAGRKLLKLKSTKAMYEKKHNKKAKAE